LKAKPIAFFILLQVGGFITKKIFFLHNTKFSGIFILFGLCQATIWPSIANIL